MRDIIGLPGHYEGIQCEAIEGVIHSVEVDGMANETHFRLRGNSPNFYIDGAQLFLPSEQYAVVYTKNIIDDRSKVFGLDIFDSPDTETPPIFSYNAPGTRWSDPFFVK